VCKYSLLFVLTPSRHLAEILSASIQLLTFHLYSCRDSFGNRYYCNSTWSNWGRWVALAVIIIFFLIIFFSCACITSRRRRRMGRQPYWGTGWAANNQQHAPAYPPQENTYYAHNQGAPAAPPYYAGRGQDTGIEMPARPENTYGAPVGGKKY
jgi:hypothetical protein